LGDIDLATVHIVDQRLQLLERHVLQEDDGVLIPVLKQQLLSKKKRKQSSVQFDAGKVTFSYQRYQTRPRLVDLGLSSITFLP